MGRKLVFAVAAGVLSAFVFAPLLSEQMVALLLGPFAMLPLFLAGLGLGVSMQIVSGAVAALISGLLGGYVGALTFAATEAVPAILLTQQALARRSGADGQRRWTPIGRLFQIAVAYGAVMLIFSIVKFSGEPGGLRGIIENMLARSAPPSPSLSAEASANLQNFFHMVAFWSPVSSSVAWLIFTLANMWLAQWMLTKWKRNLRPALGWRSLEVPRWNMALLAIAILLWVVGTGDLEYGGFSVAALLIMPYVFVGLVIIHMLTRNWGPGPYFLIGFYLLLVFTRLPALIPAAALGFVDQWARLRDRLAKRAPS